VVATSREVEHVQGNRGARGGVRLRAGHGGRRTGAASEGGERDQRGHRLGSGVPENYANSCVFTRPDGDQYFTTDKLSAASGLALKGGVTQGTSVITGGTGKLAGITGTIEWTRYGVRPAMEGTAQTVTRGKANYKLP